MKKNTFNPGRRIFPILVLAIALVAFSCEKEEFSRENRGSKAAAGATADLKKAPAPGELSIAETAIEGGFTQLVALLQLVDAELNAGLVDLFLNGKNQYTVFAPTDEAFEALFAFTAANNIVVTPELVLDILLYHVADGRRAANSVVPPTGTRKITTLLGKTFEVNSKGEINDLFGQTAKITRPNVSASNGIIHIIDTVILPLE
jgi:uncharacterized surface protein with fasciclin (FAS1) repeats